MSPLRQAVAGVRDSFWFAPAVCTLLAIGLAEGLAAWGRAHPLQQQGGAGLLLSVGADGSRSLLGAIATSVLGAAATTFSITIAVLALTSSAYGPRLVRNFLSDRGNQTVLGVLVGTAVYALLVLRHIRVLDLDSDEPAFVPHLAVNAAVVLALAAVAALVYFIHHISVSIQVATISARVRASVLQLADDLYPARPPQDRSRAGDRLVPDGVGAAAVHATGDGYVTAVDAQELVRAARDAGSRVELAVRPGDFVVDGDVIAHVAGDAPELADAVRSAVVVRARRTPYHDVELVVRQHVDLLLRALSPGTNDPLTAMNAIDDLSAGLSRIVSRPDPADVLLDEDGAARVRLRVLDPADLVRSTFDLSRPYLVGHPEVALRLLDALRRIAGAARSEATVTAVVEQVEALAEQVRGEDHVGRDRRRLRERTQDLLTDLAARPAQDGTDRAPSSPDGG